MYVSNALTMSSPYRRAVILNKASGIQLCLPLLPSTDLYILVILFSSIQLHVYDSAYFSMHFILIRVIRVVCSDIDHLVIY